MSPKNMFLLAKEAVNAWVDDFAPSMGAAISYYTVFSIAPLMLIVTVVAGMVFGQEAVRGSLQTQISGLVGNDGAAAIQTLVADAYKPGQSLVASAISIAVLLLGATTVFAELQSSLDRVWHVPERKKPSGLWGILRARFLSFGLILGLGFLLMTSLAVGAAISAFGTWFGGLLPGWEILLQLLNIAISLSVETLLFGMIYKLMPSIPIAWRDVWVGGAVTAVLFELGKTLIGVYMGKAAISSSYAAAGSIVVVLIWVYYAAQIFLLGAEFTKVYSKQRTAMEDEVSPAKAELPSASQTIAPVREEKSMPAIPEKPRASIAQWVAVKVTILAATAGLKYILNRRKRSRT